MATAVSLEYGGCCALPKGGGARIFEPKDGMMTRVAALHRHPVKGLSREVIAEARLEADGFFPGDRLFAFENGPSGFEVANPQHQPKIKYLMLMRHEALAALDTRYDEAARVLSIAQNGTVLAQGCVDDAEGRAVLERFFEGYLDGAIRGPVKLLQAPAGYRFMDSRQGFVSLLNLATIAAIGAAIGHADLDPVRFRGNIHIEGLEAFAENDWVGKTLRLGEAELEVIKRTDRCAATDVNPASAQRDTSMVGALERLYGHHDCGIYARIKKAGVIGPGLDVEILD